MLPGYRHTGWTNFWHTFITNISRYPGCCLPTPPPPRLTMWSPLHLCPYTPGTCKLHPLQTEPSNRHPKLHQHGTNAWQSCQGDNLIVLYALYLMQNQLIEKSLHFQRTLWRLWRQDMHYLPYTVIWYGGWSCDYKRTLLLHMEYILLRPHIPENKIFHNTMESQSIKNRKVNPSGTEMSFALPCLSFDDFDRTGNFSLPKICRVFQGARTVPLGTKGFLDVERESLLANGAVFIVAGDYTFSASLFQRARQLKFEMQLNLYTRLERLGRSSITMRSELRDPTAHMEVLASLTFVYVLVDKETRRSRVLPKWMPERYGQFRSSASYMSPYRLMTQPAHAYTVPLPFRVMASDTDFNQHTNQSTYIRMCLDGAYEASRKAVLKAFRGDIAHYNCKAMNVLYISESRYGDKLRVCLWEDQHASFKIHFQVFNDRCPESNPLFQCSMQFHPHLSKI